MMASMAKFESGSLCEVEENHFLKTQYFEVSHYAGPVFSHRSVWLDASCLSRGSQNESFQREGERDPELHPWISLVGL